MYIKKDVLGNGSGGVNLFLLFTASTLKALTGIFESLFGIRKGMFANISKKNAYYCFL